MEEILRISLGMVTVLGFGALMGIGLTLASKKLRVEKDRTIEDLESALPGINCGACGYAGCSGYAEALAKKEDLDITKCKPGGHATLESVAHALGQEVQEPGIKMVAQVHCLGGDNEAKDKYTYTDIADCRGAANRFLGSKQCSYGCLGMGSCIKVCPTDAIRIGDSGTAIINKELCIACEKCIEICPTLVIKMIPYDVDYYVACNSKDKGKTTKNNCSVGCIGCKICEKKFPEAGFIVKDFLAELDYQQDRCDQRGDAAEKCPSKCIIKVP